MENKFSHHIQEINNLLTLLKISQNYLKNNEHLYKINEEILEKLISNLKTIKLLFKNSNKNGSLELIRTSYELILILLFFFKEQDEVMAENKYWCYLYIKQMEKIQKIKENKKEVIKEKDFYEKTFNEVVPVLDEVKVQKALNILESNCNYIKNINLEVKKEIELKEGNKYINYYNFFFSPNGKVFNYPTTLKKLADYLSVTDYHSTLYPVYSAIIHGTILEFYDNDIFDETFSNGLNAISILSAFMTKKISITLKKDTDKKIKDFLGKRQKNLEKLIMQENNHKELLNKD